MRVILHTCVANSAVISSFLAVLVLLVAKLGCTSHSPLQGLRGYLLGGVRGIRRPDLSLTVASNPADASQAGLDPSWPLTAVLTLQGSQVPTLSLATGIGGCAGWISGVSGGAFLIIKR